ncbi:unnamed protein product [Closterium sp. Naga37s-1]|nr:unnamed protein product [Closterium sp. Naga37s-1]
MRVRSRKSRRGDDRPNIEGGGVTRGTPSLVCSSKVDDVPHLSEWIPDLQTYSNPLVLNPAYAYVDQYFVEPNDMVCQQVSARLSDLDSISYFRRAGPRERIVYHPREVRAAIVTCGGLCPGLNTVIREIVWGLWFQYGARHILGIDGGYRGFYSRNLMELNPWVINDIHKRGGTFLGTSRGGHDTTRIVNSIEDRGINQVFIIGGDGTQRGAELIYEETRRRGLKVAVAGIPKTIDNDIAIIDRSFGFDTAVEEAQRAIYAAHVEAESTRNGVGLVKLMGRYCGQIAMHATLASRDVDCCLIPEVPFHLEGPGGLFDFIDRRLYESEHCVLVVAEGAGQENMARHMSASDDDVAGGAGMGRDASGNAKLMDVGLWMSAQIKSHFARQRKEIQLKYIDPTYMIRAIPANASDNIYCTLLAHGAVHGVMAGYTGFIVGPVNNRHCYIPVNKITQKPNSISLTDRMWARLLAATSQPSFLRIDPTATTAASAGADGAAAGSSQVPEGGVIEGEYGENVLGDVGLAASYARDEEEDGAGVVRSVLEELGEDMGMDELDVVVGNGRSGYAASHAAAFETDDEAAMNAGDGVDGGLQK